MSFSIGAIAENDQAAEITQEKNNVDFSPTPLPSIGKTASAASKAAKIFPRASTYLFRPTTY
jgi:hypothetical protein